MIYRATITSEIGSGMTVEIAFEHMTEGVEEAEAHGEQDAEISKAWMQGFGQADLG